MVLVRIIRMIEKSDADVHAVFAISPRAAYPLRRPRLTLTSLCAAAHAIRTLPRGEHLPPGARPLDLCAHGHDIYLPPSP